MLNLIKKVIKKLPSKDSRVNNYRKVTPIKDREVNKALESIVKGAHQLFNKFFK